MLEDLNLDVRRLTPLFQLTQVCFVVVVVELFEFLVEQNSIAVLVDSLEESDHVVALEREAEVLRQLLLEVFHGKH